MAGGDSDIFGVFYRFHLQLLVPLNTFFRMLRGISSRFCTIGRSHIIVATQQRRNFGIGDTLMNMATKKVEQGKGTK